MRLNDWAEAEKAPKIEFPCEYPVKVLGRSAAAFESAVLEVVERHAPGFPRERITTRLSRKGAFTAITVVITATGVAQLRALHADLMATGQVQLVL